MESKTSFQEVKEIPVGIPLNFDNIKTKKHSANNKKIKTNKKTKSKDYEIIPDIPLKSKTNTSVLISNKILKKYEEDPKIFTNLVEEQKDNFCGFITGNISHKSPPQCKCENCLLKLKIDLNYFFQKNFQCKLHINKYYAYCLTCSQNICRECLGPESKHIKHKIMFFDKYLLPESRIKNYQTIYYLRKCYLQKIRETIIKLVYELNEYANESTLANKLIRAYKQFYTRNYYQLNYENRIIYLYSMWNKFGYINYQIISNLYNIKLNSAKIPEVTLSSDTDILLRTRIMIEFLRDSKSNILRSSDSEHSKELHCYVKKNKTIDNNVSNNDYSSIKIPTFFFDKQNPDIYDPEMTTEKQKISNEETENNINLNNYFIKNPIITEEKIKENLKNSEKLTNNLFKNNINNNKKKIPKNKLNEIQIENSSNEDIKTFIFSYLKERDPNEELEYKENLKFIYLDKKTDKSIKCVYHGECKKGTYKRHGRGLFAWEDGEKYLGYWVNDKREGYGENCYANGNFYEGNYKNGKKEGKGNYKWKNGDEYEGEWKNDMKEGEGKYKCANGDYYEGNFKNDKINGNGTYFWANENSYEGEFKNNLIEGRGTLKYKKKNSRSGKNKDNDNNGNSVEYIQIYTCNSNNKKSEDLFDPFK